MAKLADLYKDGNRVDTFRHTLGALGKYGKGHYLKLPDIDMREFTIPKGSVVVGAGPNAVAELAKKRYGNNPYSLYTNRLTLPKYYVRIGEVHIRPKVGSKPEESTEEQRMRDYLGDYVVIQYFFFYIFNDFWNKHLGDWDSTIEVLIKKKTNEKFAFYSMHETRWLTKLVRPNPDLNEWIKEWRKNIDGNKGLGTAYKFKNHLFSFVSKGSHGVYPTPGYTIFGVNLPFTDDIIGATDERLIGYTCIAPKDVSEDDSKNF